jgi:putative aldouronate transport system permease protein
MQQGEQFLLRTTAGTNEGISNNNNGFFKSLLKQRALLMMALPGILVVIIFNYIPMYGITIAFQEFSPVKG